jgi:hypothetical protein
MRQLNIGSINKSVFLYMNNIFFNNPKNIHTYSDFYSFINSHKNKVNLKYSYKRHIFYKTDYKMKFIKYQPLEYIMDEWLFNHSDIVLNSNEILHKMIKKNFLSNAELEYWNETVSLFVIYQGLKEYQQNKDKSYINCTKTLNMIKHSYYKIENINPRFSNIKI